MIVPPYTVCKKCGRKQMPGWFRNKMHEWRDMGYPYDTFRPSLIVGTQNLCDDCRGKVIHSFDMANHFKDKQNGGII